MNYRQLILFSLFVIACLFHLALSNVNAAQLEILLEESGTQTSGQSQDADSLQILMSMEKGIASGNVQAFGEYFHRQVFVNLQNLAGSGYYSANQAQLILQDFLSTRRPSGFRFTSMNFEKEPYATGGGYCNIRGNREFLQVYVAISKIDGRWVITQFNIY